MAIKSSESNIKVLKKCKECGIYPSFYKDERLYFMRCPKCLQLAFSPNGAVILQENWNMQNGFDENDESTWNDEPINDKEKHKQKLRAIAKAFIEYNEHENR